MNIEKICSPYTDLATLTEAFNHSRPEFKRGVFDMCAAFNLKVDVQPRSAPYRDDVWLVTPNGWIAGRLLYPQDDSGHYFKYVSRSIRKARGDGRADRNARAANKISDLIKVLRAKKEMITDANAFEYEKRAVGYAHSCIRKELEQHQTPKVVIGYDAAEAVFRAVLDGSPLPEALRVDVEEAKVRFRQEETAYKEATNSLRMFEQGCYAVGLLEHWSGETHYFVGKLKLIKGQRGDATIEPHGDVKRYTTLVGTELETDAAIIRTFMQSHPHYEAKNELGLPRNDKYYPEVEVATGYAGDTMTWALLPVHTPV